MKRFSYQGPIQSSKSLFNRALVISSFFPQLKVMGQSLSKDVVAMQKAIKQIADSTNSKNLRIDCAEAGTVIRFLAFRLSRIPGEHLLTGSERLLSRPMDELTEILRQLGVKAEKAAEGLWIRGEGWQKPAGALQVQREKSSQFASGLLLSSWELPFDLEIQMLGNKLSEPYWQMTKSLCQELGMLIQEREEISRIPAKQKITNYEYKVEPDYSSMFAVAALAALYGEADFTNMGEDSLQPDFVFKELLVEMGAGVNGSRITKAQRMKSISAKLRDAPDLFPVLACLCAFADEGVSRLYGAPHLRFKESDRIGKTHELLKLAGVDCLELPDGLEIMGEGMEFRPKSFVFDPDKDHRMAMAAALFAFKNPEIQILHPEVVDKSFPGFWKLLEGRLP